MEDLWTTDFVPADIDTPYDIVKKQCELLARQTNGKIVARIANYTGPTKNYTKPNVLKSISSMYAEKEISIQDDLGEISLGSDFTFEFFITSTNTPNYKYRVMFLQHGIAFYPVYIVLDESIADELELDIDCDSIKCDSDDDFKQILKKILNSKSVVTVINGLLTIARQEERVLL